MPVQDMLAGLRILEVAEGVAGPMCGKVFVDLGASVTRVEPPRGDWILRLADSAARVRSTISSMPARPSERWISRLRPVRPTSPISPARPT